MKENEHIEILNLSRLINVKMMLFFFYSHLRFCIHFYVFFTTGWNAGCP